jgi:hypothetical protein
MTVKNALAGIAVTDLGISKDWYQKLFGREPDTHPMEELFEWEFPTDGWIQLFQSRSLAGSSSVTLVENDFGKRLKDLRAARYDIKKLVDSDNIKVAIIEDPDGNEVVFAQAHGVRHKAVA